MNNRTYRVAITGMGIVTALGKGKEQNWQALANGESGTHLITRFSTEGMPTRFAACVAGIGRDKMPSFERAYEMALSVCDEALEQSGVTFKECHDSRLFLAISPGELEWETRLCVRRMLPHQAKLHEQLAQCSPELRERVFESGLDMVIGDRLSEKYGIVNPPVATNTACASGASAIQLAMQSIRFGETSMAIAVGSDSTIWPEGMVRFSLLSALSTRNDEPEKASRPFTVDRDGFVMGEGAAALILEDLDHARARGATILGYLLGSGDATDNFHRTRSHPSGAAIIACMRKAVEDAKLPLEAIHYINAHGTSTPENDKMEALGIEQLFNGNSEKIPVSSNKSMIGHTLTACGATEAVFTVLTLQNQLLPPTINHDSHDPNVHLDVVPNLSRPASVEFALSNSFGFGGQNVTLVFGHAESQAVAA